METPSPKHFYVLYCKRTHSVITVQEMSIHQKIVTNGYTWLKKADLEWMSFADFKKADPVDGRHKVQCHDRRFVSYFDQA